MTSLLALRRRITDLRYDLAILNSEIKYRKLVRTLRTSLKYDPAQPREPAGSPIGGRWANTESPASEGSGGNGGSLDLLEISNRPSAAFCWNQLQIDGLFCSAQFPAPRRASCYRQAMERYANCLTGKPLPPLNF